jgi:hypothetical protein
MNMFLISNNAFRKLLLSATLLLLILGVNAQKYWESGSWKKYLSKVPDSTGVYEEFYKDGTLKIHGEFVHGIPVNDWMFYDENGQVLIQSNFNGKYEFNDPYSHFVKRKQTGTYKNGQRTGTWIEEFYDAETDTLQSKKEYDFDSETMTTTYADEEYPVSVAMNRKKYLRTQNQSGGIMLGLGYGYMPIDLSSLNKAYDGTSSENFNSNLPIINLTIAYNLQNTSYLSFEFFPVLPQEIKVNSGNPHKLNGAVVMINYGYDFVKRDIFDLAPTIGVGVAAFQIDKLNDSDVTVNLGDNEAVLLKVGVNFRYNLVDYNSLIHRGIMSIGFDAGYKYDVSKTTWNKEDNTTSIPGNPKTSFSGFYFQVFLSTYIKNFRSF